MKKIYKISDVAKMFGISRTKLIHYDKWGILCPSIRNEKNYRFYTTDDIKKLELILAFQESGLSLDEIKSYLNNDSDISSVQLLNRQLEEIQKKIKTLKKQSLVIEKKIQYLTKFHDMEMYEGILLEDYPEGYIIYETVGYGPLKSYSSAINKLKSTLEAEGRLTSKFSICIDITHTDASGKYVIKYVFDNMNGLKEIGNQKKIPKSKYLRKIHNGNKDNVESTIKQVLEYASLNDYKTGDEAYYIPLYDYWESMSDGFIGEILIPIVTNK
jgi:DNA-binding transcriptional MerR regulator/uncharacterized protein YlbG (UPF0298 family)